MTYEDLDPSATQSRLDEGDWVFLDVRTPQEYAAGHLPGAYNVPFALYDPMRGMVPNPEFVEVMGRRFEKGAGLVIGCATGVRSVYACEILAQEGFEKLANLTGGYDGRPGSVGWVEAEMPTTVEAGGGRTWPELRTDGD